MAKISNKKDGRSGQLLYTVGKEEVMGKKKPAGNKDIRIEFRTDATWYDAVSEEASRMGLSLASYLRLAAIEKMDRDKAKRGNDQKGE